LCSVSAASFSGMFRDLKITLAASFAAVTVLADDPAGITKCQAGAADILGDRKAFTVQVCNLFGATCVLNHPSVASDDCATQALSIASGECKLYPIFEYQDWGVRSGDSAVEELSTIGDLGCSVSSSGSTYKWSGACASVQCSLGSDSWAGPGMTKTGTSSLRATGITDTAAATWEANTVASITADADQLKNVFLIRTGEYVATDKKSGSGSSGSISYTMGRLPTSDGNNYGPVACPSRQNLLSSTAADGITAENLRMCGSTGKWTYWNALNFLEDKSMYTDMTSDTTIKATTPYSGLSSVPFLMGKSVYRSGVAMDDARAVRIHKTSAATSDVLLTSSSVSPKADGAADGETAGTWRNYGVVFYCNQYDRTDLTTCPASNRKIFYVADPNPGAQFGEVPGGIGKAGSGSASFARQTSAAGLFAAMGVVVFASANFF